MTGARAQPSCLLVALLGSVLGWVGCSVGSGEGFVESDRLVVEGCIDDSYSMEPNYFAASYADDSHLIRIQRGSSPQKNSDALVIYVRDVETIIDSRLGEPLEVAVAPELLPEGLASTTSIDPIVTANLHLGETCEEEVISLSAVSGTITFEELFDGKGGITSKKRRKMAGSFEFVVADPRDLVADETSPLGYRSPNGSTLLGEFSFTYKKGQPAQAFP